MPYINHNDRDRFDPVPTPNSAGELNYLITQVALNYLSHAGKNYQTINETVGALECAKLEFYRRLAVPYEDAKIAQNGDVYP